MQKVFYILFSLITIITTSCFAEVVQNQTDLTGTVWKYTFVADSSKVTDYSYEELKFISGSQGEVWMQPITGDKQMIKTLTYVVNGTTITITPSNGKVGTAVIDFQKNTIIPTDAPNTYVFTKE